MNISGDSICLSTWFCMINQTHSFLYVGAVFAAKFFHPSASSVISSRILLSSMRTLTSALKQRKTYATPQPSTSTETEKGLMRCLAQEKRGYMIGYGCILDWRPLFDEPYMLNAILCFPPNFYVPTQFYCQTQCFGELCLHLLAMDNLLSECLVSVRFCVCVCWGGGY